MKLSPSKSAVPGYGSSGGGRVYSPVNRVTTIVDCFPSTKASGISCIGNGQEAWVGNTGTVADGSWVALIRYTAPVEGWTTTTP